MASSQESIIIGLVSLEDHRLEVTNCFPTAKAEPMIDGDETNQTNYQYEEQKQAEMLDMLRKFRYLLNSLMCSNLQLFFLSVAI